MSKEFDEFMSIMSEIPTNHNNDVREEMDLFKILTSKVKTEISDTSTNSSSYSSGYRQAMIIVEAWIIDILAQVPQQNDVNVGYGDRIYYPNNDVREDDVEKLAIDKIIEKLESIIVLSAHNKLGSTQRTGEFRIGLRKAIDICSEVKDELIKGKENTYTEEQVREAIELADRYNYLLESDKNEIIQSLKQHKK